MNKNLKASVVIPTLNRQDVLIKCLKVLLKQKEDIFEIIVVDQTETKTKELENFLKAHPEINYFYFEKKNLPAARNYGTKQAQGEIILFLDDDSIVQKGLIKAHLNNYKDPKIGAVTGREILKDNPSFFTSGKAQIITEKGEVKPNTTSITKGEVDSVWGANMSFRKEVLQKIGGFDENYIGNAIREESDVSIRARISGYKIIYEPKAKIIHLAKQSGGSRDEQRIRWYFNFFHNEFYFFLKFFPRKYLIHFFLRKLRPILACIFWYGKLRPLAFKTPFLAFKEAFLTYRKNKGSDFVPTRIGIDAREAYELKKAGKGEYTYHLVRALRKIDSKNLYFVYTRAPIKEKLGANFKNIPVSSGPFSILKMLFHIFSEGIDLFFSPTSFIIPAILPKKSIAAVHDLAVFRKNFKPLLKAKILETLLLGRIVKRSKILIAVSESTKKDIIERFKPLDIKKIKIVSPACDPTLKKPSDAKAEKIIKKYNIKEPFILSLGTIEPRKNFKNLILAFSKIKRSLFEKYTLLIIGKKGWNSEEVFEMVKNNKKLKNKVKFLGYLPREEISAFYSKAKMFAFPSLWEGFGIPILEAFYFKTPVLTSNVSSMPEVAGEAALYVNPEDIEDIKEKLELLLSDERLREKLKEESQKQIQKFSYNKGAEKLLGIFKNFVKIK